MENLWLLKQMLDPEDTGSVNDEPVTIFYDEIVFSNAKFTYEDKLGEVEGVV